MLDNIIGSIFFEFIGVFIKWTFYLIVNKIKGKKVISFKNVWNGRRSKDKSEIFMNGFSNIAIGMISTLLFLLFFN